MNIVVSRDANRIESDQRPIRYEITPSVKAIVELVGGYVPQVGQHYRQKDGVIKQEQQRKETGDPVLPSVGKKEQLAPLAAHIPLVEVE